MESSLEAEKECKVNSEDNSYRNSDILINNNPSVIEVSKNGISVIIYVPGIKDEKIGKRASYVVNYLYRKHYAKTKQRRIKFRKQGCKVSRRIKDCIMGLFCDRLYATNLIYKKNVAHFKVKKRNCSYKLHRLEPKNFRKKIDKMVKCIIFSLLSPLSSKTFIKRSIFLSIFSLKVRIINKNQKDTAILEFIRIYKKYIRDFIFNKRSVRKYTTKQAILNSQSLHILLSIFEETNSKNLDAFNQYHSQSSRKNFYTNFADLLERNQNIFFGEVLRVNYYCFFINFKFGFCLKTKKYALHTCEKNQKTNHILPKNSYLQQKPLKMKEMVPKTTHSFFKSSKIIECVQLAQNSIKTKITFSTLKLNEFNLNKKSGFVPLTLYSGNSKKPNFHKSDAYEKGTNNVFCFLTKFFCVFLMLYVRTKDTCLPGSSLCKDNSMYICDVYGNFVVVDCPEKTSCAVKNGVLACYDKNELHEGSFIYGSQPISQEEIFKSFHGEKGKPENTHKESTNYHEKGEKQPHSASNPGNNNITDGNRNPIKQQAGINDGQSGHDSINENTRGLEKNNVQNSRDSKKSHKDTRDHQRENQSDHHKTSKEDHDEQNTHELKSQSDTDGSDQDYKGSLPTIIKKIIKVIPKRKDIKMVVLDMGNNEDSDNFHGEDEKIELDTQESEDNTNQEDKSQHLSQKRPEIAQKKNKSHHIENNHMGSMQEMEDQSHHSLSSDNKNSISEQKSSPKIITKFVQQHDPQIVTVTQTLIKHVQPSEIRFEMDNVSGDMAPLKNSVIIPHHMPIREGVEYDQKILDAIHAKKDIDEFLNENYAPEHSNLGKNTQHSQGHPSNTSNVMSNENSNTSQGSPVNTINSSIGQNISSSGIGGSLGSGGISGGSSGNQSGSSSSTPSFGGSSGNSGGGGKKPATIPVNSGNQSSGSNKTPSGTNNSSGAGGSTPSVPSNGNSNSSTGGSSNTTSKGSNNSSGGSGSSSGGSNTPSGGSNNTSGGSGSSSGGSNTPSGGSNNSSGGSGSSSGGSNTPSGGSNNSSGGSGSSSGDSNTPSDGDNSNGDKNQNPSNNDSKSDTKTNGEGGSITLDQLKSSISESGFKIPGDDVLNPILDCINEEFSDKNESAAFIAQLIHESGGFQHTSEIACEGDGCQGNYESATDIPGKDYYGRGYIQLTWSENYKKASEELGLGDELLQNPDMVAKDPKIAIQTALWYWKKHVQPTNFLEEKKFGLTTKAINGPLECGTGSETPAKRYDIYTKVAENFGVENLLTPDGC